MQRKLTYVGFANSIFQSSGHICGNSNWTASAKKGTVPDPNTSINHWHHFDKDLDEMKKLGVNSYRFSIEWSHIEPEEGKIDYEVLAKYADMIKACKTRDIEPMLTLYHFNEPLWFSDKGGFKKEENIEYYLKYAKLVFNHFKQDVKLWGTFNEPGIQAYMGYLLGKFPPHEHNIKDTVIVVLNFLKAHVATYNTLKKGDTNSDCQIGIVHNVLRFLPRFTWEPIESAVCDFFTSITDDLVMNFFKTGNFHYQSRVIKDIQYSDPSAVNAFDFFGLNFYANAVIGFNSKNFFGATSRNNKPMTDMYVTIDPEGFSNAIDAVSTLGKPIFITEIGIADAKDTMRQELLTAYFQVLEQKRLEGKDIRGCFFWSYADNYEWNEGYSKKFGFFDHERKPKESSKQITDFINKVMRI